MLKKNLWPLYRPYRWPQRSPNTMGTSRQLGIDWWPLVLLASTAEGDGQQYAEQAPDLISGSWDAQFAKAKKCQEATALQKELWLGDVRSLNESDLLVLA